MKTFYFTLDEEGIPVLLLHGHAAVTYIDGKRVEKPAMSIEAESWHDAVAAILAGRQVGKTWPDMGVKEAK